MMLPFIFLALIQATHAKSGKWTTIYYNIYFAKQTELFNIRHALLSVSPDPAKAANHCVFDRDISEKNKICWFKPFILGIAVLSLLTVLRL